MTLEEIAKKMCARGKGILAADESTGTIAKRFKSINVENTEKNRIIFREALFSADAMKNYIGGELLFDETIKQKSSLGTFFLRQSKVLLAISSELDLSLHPEPGKTIFGFKTVPVKSTFCISSSL